jgi:crotonobetainyl-CoA:carnitine CoA-transferase CaiB-like acyl-CoA transferase
LFEEEVHPVTGACDIPSLPFRFSRVSRWSTRPSPTLGEHTAEVLGEIGMPDAVERLRAEGVTGERLG